MDGNTIHTLAQYIAEHHRRNRYNYGTDGGGAFDSTIESHTTGDQGDRSRDERSDQNNPG
jgi:hypothetical protein